MGSPKKIAVNTRLLLKGKLEGIGRVGFSLLSRLVQQHPLVEFHFLFDRQYDSSFVFADNVIPHVISPPSRHPLLWYLWFERGVKKKLAQIKPEVFFSIEGFGQLSTSIKTVVLLHDINFYHYPRDLPFLHQWFYNKYFPLYAKRAQKVITVSNFCKQDICENLSISKNAVEVIYNGVEDSFLVSKHPDPPIKEPYFFYIGSIHPRKNIAIQLKAFDLFKKRTKASHKFILAGNKKWWTTKDQETFQELEYKNSVVFLGRIDQKSYLTYLQHAFCLMYVSTFEGFGLPIIEAMSVGIPVITGSGSAMPEVSGAAALLANPMSVEDIANHMESLQDVDLYDLLKEKGRKRSKDFSWDRSAEQLWKILTNA